jgi:hypothetical protein
LSPQDAARCVDLLDRQFPGLGREVPPWATGSRSGGGGTGHQGPEAIS